MLQCFAQPYTKERNQEADFPQPCTFTANNHINESKGKVWRPVIVRNMQSYTERSRGKLLR